MAPLDKPTHGVHIQGEVVRENNQPLDADEFLTLFIEFVESHDLLFNGMTYPTDEEGEFTAPHASSKDLAQMAHDTKGLLEALMQRREEDILDFTMHDLDTTLSDILDTPVTSQAIQSPEGIQVSAYYGELVEHSYHGDHLTSIEAGDLIAILLVTDDDFIETVQLSEREDDPHLLEFLKSLPGHRFYLPTP